MSLPGMDAVALERFLRERGVDVNGELRVELLSGGRSNLTFAARDDTSRWVVRRPPVAGLTPSAHDMAREFTVTSALHGSAVPVAKTIAFDPDGAALGAPMTVVEYVDGIVIRDQDDLDTLTDQQVTASVAELVRVLAELHAVNPQQVGLGNFGRPVGFVARQVDLWASQWQRVKTRDLPDVERLYTALSSAVPADSAASIVHGDFRIDNTILDPADPGRVCAVVDWELSALGDPLTDVALMCVYRAPVFDLVLGSRAAWTSDRLPTSDDLAQTYATVSGRDLGNWGFYLALANFKLGIIGEGISYRALRGSDAGSAAERAAEATPEFMAAGLRALNGDRQ
ncbi:phosphotransferase family protein [Nocardia donostiensis]|uniref:Acyl-CoA dehydrogenase n=1 Tax=Nocardia donostiensis TaxID=1538463 RepID=A0A1V2TJQ7_9NOCA|nr:phosphotransferase family protein [Nocardia donostiensis]ONM49759.1 acyl-CoA dehydrogenase [Nocardia donostiensis]OQS15358.1 acyl-CoA dehydrogenase [Nocardia donostiensis]OQS19852.1 acyl-CoA dehydrogenase [Nocardia donostiensis]